MDIRELVKLGNINKCLSPNRIVNPYTHEVLYVPCRCCDACLNARATYWASRVSKECTFHRYSVFLTLTYDNDHLPLFECNESNSDRYISNRLIEDYYDILDIPPYSKNIPIQHDRKFNRYAIPYVSRDDCKLFIKRLRSHIDYLFKKQGIKNENKRIRYFLVSEYGPKTYRPHYHAILWIDSERILSSLQELLSKSWKNGAFDFSLVESSAPRYVAKYVTGNTSLPAILRTKLTRTFHLQSKKPCIGYSSYDKEKLFENVFNGTYGHREYDIASKSSVYVQPPRSLEMSYFPKCRGYRTISDFEKLRIYSYSYDVARTRGIKTWKEYTRFFFTDETVSEKPNPTDLHCSYACYRWCLDTGFTPEIYVQKLIAYYKQKELYLLHQQLLYEKMYIEVYGLPKKHLFGIDPLFYEDLPHYFSKIRTTRCYGMMKSWHLSDIEMYKMFYTCGVLDTNKVMKARQESSAFYNENVQIQRNMVIQSNKNKSFNEDINLFNY